MVADKLLAIVTFRNRTPHGWLTMRKQHIPDYRLTDIC
jgi:hypothetical protein